MSIKFGLPSLVYHESNQELEDDFRTPNCIFRNPEIAQKSYSAPSKAAQQGSKKPVIKLQRSTSTSSFNSSTTNCKDCNIMVG